MVAMFRQLLILASFWAGVFTAKPRTEIFSIAARYEQLDEFPSQHIKSIDLLLGFDEGDDENISIDFMEQIDLFKDDEVVEDFVKLLAEGFLGQGEPFTMRDPETREQTIKIFDLLYFTKDYQVFQNVAHWLRPKMNREQFIYVVSMALVYRDDFYYELPPWYEVFPHYFVPHQYMEAVRQANRTGENQDPILIDTVGSDIIAYFREDVELNNLYFNWLFYFPNWFSPERYNMIDWKYRGEQFWYFHTLLTSRYNVEKWAQGLGLVESIDWSDDVMDCDTQIWKNWTTPFPVRPEMDDLPAEQVEKILARGEIITSDMEVFDENLDLFMNTLYGTEESLNLTHYGTYFDEAIDFLASLGVDKENKSEAWNVMGNPMTALRDQLYFNFIVDIAETGQLYSKITNAPYNNEHLVFTNVSIRSMEVSKLMTYFDDDFEFDVTNGMEERSSEGGYKVRQRRLNHWGFTVNLTIHSTRKPAKNTGYKTNHAMIRLFLMTEDTVYTPDLYGPPLAYEFDRFPVQIIKGTNVIVRKSTDSTVFTESPPGLFTQYNNYKYPSTSKRHPIKYYHGLSQCGLPYGLMLPHGKPESDGGLRMYMMAFISEMADATGLPDPENRRRHFEKIVPCGGQIFDDFKDYGYPLGRPVKPEVWNKLTNKLVIPVNIYHKSDDDESY